jgi:replicative DNA helicase
MLNQTIEKATIPQDYEAEQAVLGSIIYDNDNINDVISILTPTSFYSPAHQHIYRAMMELNDLKQPIDELLLGDQLKSLNQLEETGGYSYLATLQDCVPGSGNHAYYADIVQEHALLRQLISTTSDIARKSRDPEGNFLDLIAELDSKTQELIQQKKTEDCTSIKDIMKLGFERLEKVSQNKNEITGLPTGLTDLDRMTSGFQDSDLIIIAGRPSMGKTALAMNIASYAAIHKIKPGTVAVFSLEMSKVQLGLRLAGSVGKVDSNLMRNGNLEQKDWDKLSMATDILCGLDLRINDKANISTTELTSAVKKLNKTEENGVSLVVVDYLQLMRGSRPNMPREQEIAEIARSLKALAKEIDCPVIALSQLNRALENRSDKRPQMSDLRESGSLEQDADIIIFVYRDEVYNEDTSDPGIAELGIAKHRNGPIGMVKTVFIGKHTSFANHSDRQPDE